MTFYKRWASLGAVCFPLGKLIRVDFRIGRHIWATFFGHVGHTERNKPNDKKFTPIVITRSAFGSRFRVLGKEEPNQTMVSRLLKLAFDGPGLQVGLWLVPRLSTGCCLAASLMVFWARMTFLVIQVLEVSNFLPSLTWKPHLFFALVALICCVKHSWLLKLIRAPLFLSFYSQARAEPIELIFVADLPSCP